MGDVKALGSWRNNAEMFVDVARLGYLDWSWRILDPTYGRGSFWKLWRPPGLVHHDLALDGVDVRELPYESGTFDAVVFDPPYKLNGTPTASADGRYGVAVTATRDDRMQLCFDGIVECARVVRADGYLLIKCQDMVNGGRMRWQTREFSDLAEQHGCMLVDMLLLHTHGRPQPERRRKPRAGETPGADGLVASLQQHSRRNYSTLLVCQKAKPKRRKR